MAWQVSMAQASELLVHRSKVIGYDAGMDLVSLRNGEPAACTSILRHAFVNFSEALAHFFVKVGHPFSDDMTNEQLLQCILAVWNTLSPQQPSTGQVTVSKFMQGGVWRADRLLFTLQCVLVCHRKHCELIAIEDEAWLCDGIDWTHTSPRTQFEDHPTVGSESQKRLSTLAWMADAYRKQMEHFPDAAGPVSSDMPPEGVEEQEAWMRRIRGYSLSSSSGSSSTYDSCCDSLADESNTDEQPSDPRSDRCNADRKDLPLLSSD
jgi:hypothetical protein